MHVPKLRKLQPMASKVEEPNITSPGTITITPLAPISPVIEPAIKLMTVIRI